MSRVAEEIRTHLVAAAGLLDVPEPRKQIWVDNTLAAWDSEGLIPKSMPHRYLTLTVDGRPYVTDLPKSPAARTAKRRSRPKPRERRRAAAPPDRLTGNP